MKRVILGVCLCFASAAAQVTLPARSTAPPEVTEADLPPSTVLAETLAPLERTRADMSNWSDVELAAFQQTSAAAKAACQRIEQTPHEGEEALALARLCALGMDWDGTYSAARWYTRANAPAGEAPHLPLGFSLLIQADLNLQAVARCLEDLAEVQKRLSFTADTNGIFSYAVQALEITRLESGLAIALMRQPLLLEALRGQSDATSVAAGLAEAQAWHTLSLLHLAERSEDERRARAELLGSIAERTTQLSAADSFLAAQGRTRYEWLARALPEFVRSGDTYPKAKTRPGRAVVQMLIVEQGGAADVPALAAGVDALRSRLASGSQAYLVLQKADAGSHPVLARAQPVHALSTEDSLLQSLGFPGAGPVFVLLDSRRKVVFLGEGSSSWLNPQMQAETLIDRAAYAESHPRGEVR